MSDFLTSLVTRSLGAAPAIQPRLPSLFEPSTPYLGSFAEASPGSEEGRREAPMQAALEGANRPPSVMQERQTTTNKARTEGNVDPRLPLKVSQPFNADEPKQRPVMRSSETAPMPAMGGVLAESVPAVRPATVHASPDEESSRSSVLPSESLGEGRGPAGVEVSPARVRKAVIGDLVAPADLLNSVAAGAGQRTGQRPGIKSEVPQRMAGDLATAETDALRQVHEMAESHAKSALVESERSHIGNLSPRATAAIEPSTAPHFEFARHVPPAPHVSPAEPTIQVTIGRIEVRALSPQATPPKERSASPVMSLNDYLRSRRGGA
jgi:hypothetical protein